MTFPIVLSVWHDIANETYPATMDYFQNFQVPENSVVTMEGWHKPDGTHKTADEILNANLNKLNIDDQFMTITARLFQQKGARIATVEDDVICNLLQDAGSKGDNLRENSYHLFRGISHLIDSASANAIAHVSGAGNAKNIEIAFKPFVDVVQLFDVGSEWNEYFSKLYKDILTGGNKFEKYQFVYNNEYLANILKKFAKLKGLPENYYLETSNPNPIRKGSRTW